MHKKGARFRKKNYQERKKQRSDISVAKHDRNEQALTPGTIIHVLPPTFVAVVCLGPAFNPRLLTSARVSAGDSLARQIGVAFKSSSDRGVIGNTDAHPLVTQ